MKRAIYLLSSIIAFSSMAFLLTIHNIGVSGGRTFARTDLVFFYVFVFIAFIALCIYKYIKSDDK